MSESENKKTESTKSDTNKSESKTKAASKQETRKYESPPVPSAGVSAVPTPGAVSDKA